MTTEHHTPTGMDQGSATWLTELGFRSDPANHRFTRGNVAIDVADGWLTVSVHEPAEVRDPLAGEAAGPGLWKTVYRDGRPRRVFEVPVSSFDGDEIYEIYENDDNGENDGKGEEGTSPISLMLAWALSTSDGRAPPWRSPPREEVDSLVDGRLTARTRSRVYRGELILERSRLALRFPLGSIPARHTPGQAAWLRQNLAFAQDLFGMVSFVREGAEVAVQVDLTNAPHALLAPLVRVSLSGLRYAVARLADSIEVLTDPSVQSWALATTASSIERTI